MVKADIGIGPAGGLDLIQCDLLDLLSAGGGLLGLGGVGRETADEGLQLGDLGLLLGVIGIHALTDLGGGGHVLIVVSGVDPQLAIVQISHMSADAVQEVAVMRDDDHGAVALV